VEADDQTCTHRSLNGLVVHVKNRFHGRQSARSPAHGTFGWVRHSPGDNEAKEGAPFQAQCLEAARDQADRHRVSQGAETVVKAGIPRRAAAVPLASNLLKLHLIDRSVFRLRIATGPITCA
jgi:hypothetical protein